MASKNKEQEVKGGNGDAVAVKPFTITVVDCDDDVAVVEIRRDVLGTVANHLKETPDGRKSASIARALGHRLSAAANILYDNEQEGNRSLLVGANLVQNGVETIIE